MTADEMNLRKAALLVASLDRRVADELLARMSPAQARRVRQAVVNLGEVSDDDQEDVLEDFTETRRLRTRHSSAGLDLELASTERLLNQQHRHDRDDELVLSTGLDHDSAIDARAGARAGMSSSNDAELVESNYEPPQPFRFLHEARMDDLAQRLAREQPTTIAVVLSHLPAEQAALALGELPESLQVDVMRRLASGAQPEQWLIQEIEDSMRAWIAPGGEISSATTGLTVAKNILSATSAASRRRLLSTMGNRDGELLHRLTGERPTQAEVLFVQDQAPSAGSLATDGPPPARRKVTFAKVESLADARLAALWMSAAPEVGLLALAGASPLLVDRVLGALPNATAATICRQLDNLGPVALADLDQAQHEMALAAEELDQAVTANAASNALSAQGASV